MAINFQLNWNVIISNKHSRLIREKKERLLLSLQIVQRKRKSCKRAVAKEGLNLVIAQSLWLINVTCNYPLTMALMSRIEHTSKNWLANCFRDFGKKGLKRTAITNV